MRLPDKVTLQGQQTLRLPQKVANRTRVRRWLSGRDLTLLRAWTRHPVCILYSKLGKACSGYLSNMHFVRDFLQKRNSKIWTNEVFEASSKNGGSRTHFKAGRHVESSDVESAVFKPSDVASSEVMSSATYLAVTCSFWLLRFIWLCLACSFWFLCFLSVPCSLWLLRFRLLFTSQSERFFLLLVHILFCLFMLFLSVTYSFCLLCFLLFFR